MTTENSVTIKDATQRLVDTARGTAYALHVLSIEKDGDSGDEGESDFLYNLSTTLFEAIRDFEKVEGQE